MKQTRVFFLLCLFLFFSLTSAQSKIDLEAFFEEMDFEPAPIESYVIKVIDLDSSFDEVVESDSKIRQSHTFTEQSNQIKLEESIDTEIASPEFCVEVNTLKAKIDKLSEFNQDTEISIAVENTNSARAAIEAILDSLDLLDLPYERLLRVSFNKARLEVSKVRSNPLGASADAIHKGFESLRGATKLFTEGLECEDASQTIALKSKNIYQFDEQGNVVERSSYNSIGNLISKSLYKYDDQDNQTADFLYDFDNSLISINKYKYDKQGNQTENHRYNFDSSLAIIEKYTYDKQGNRTEASLYNAGGNLTSTEKYQYDEQGNRIKDSEYGFDSFLEFQERCEYEYDKYSNWTKRTCVEYVAVLLGDWQPDYSISDDELTLREIKYHE